MDLFFRTLACGMWIGGRCAVLANLARVHQAWHPSGVAKMGRKPFGRLASAKGVVKATVIFFLSHECYRLNSELIICLSWQFWHEEIEETLVQLGEFSNYIVSR